MEIIFLSFAAMAAIVGIQLLEQLTGLGSQNASARGADRLTFTPARIKHAARLTEPRQELDEAA